MSHRKVPSRERKAAAVTAVRAQSEPRLANSPAVRGVGQWLPYGLCLVLFWTFCTVVYGDVFVRTAQANFVTANAYQMKFVLDQPWGWLYWPGRYLLLVCQKAVLGGLLLSLMLTAAVALADRVLRLPASWRGASAVVPALLLGWMLWRGTNLYYKNEPSLIVVLPALLVLALAVVAVVVRLLRKRQSPAPQRRWRPYGLLVPAVAFAALTYAAKVPAENVVLTARMQNRLLQADWDGIIDDAVSARRPSRAVAAYYAVALLQKGQLLERLFDIPFDFPEIRFDRKEGGEEYGIFVADCNFYSGLINPAYRCAFEHVVMNGPNLYYLKRMTACAVVNGERQLAEKYLAILESMPFNGEFVSKYRAFLNDPELMQHDAVLAQVVKLIPESAHFEQNYRQPIFLGYNMAMTGGSDVALEAAIAANLYSKSLPQAMNYVLVYYQKHGGVLPPAVAQAVFIAANSTPRVAEAFPEVVRNGQAQAYTFFSAIRHYYEERNREIQGKSADEQEALRRAYNARMRQELKADWQGTYYYYYFCENNDQNQIPASKQSGVN